MKGKQRGIGILLNYLNEGVKILTALVYTPLMLRLLGQQEYGLYQLAVSVVSYLGLLNLGFGSGYVRSYARLQVKGDQAGIARLNGMFLLIFGFLGGISLLSGGVLICHAETVLGKGLKPEELEKAKSLLGILTGNLALTLINSLFDSHITAREQFLLQKLLRLAQSLFGPFLTFPLLLMGYGAEAVVLVSLTLTAAVLICNIYCCRKRLKMEFCFQDLQFSELRELWSFTFFVFLNQIIDQANWNVDKLLLGRMRGTAAVAVYGVGAQIYSMYMQLSIAVSGEFQPKVNRLAAQSGDTRELSRLMAQVGRIQALVLMPVLTGFLFWGREFLKLWAGEDYREAYLVALLLMVPATIPLIQNLVIEFQRARNRHRVRSVVYACLAAGNVILSIGWIRRWGCTGAAAGTAVTLVLGNVLFMNWYYQKRLKLDMELFWKEIGRLVPVWVLAGLFGGVLSAAVTVTTWGELMTVLGLYSGGYGLAVLVLAQKRTGDRKTPVPGGVKR